MYEDLRERAILNIEKKQKKRKATQIIAVIFGSVAILLFVISLFMWESERIFMAIPITILGLVYGIIYTAINGFPFLNNDAISETTIENEVAKIYRRSRIHIDEDMSEDERLELRQLDEQLIELEEGEDYV